MAKSYSYLRKKAGLPVPAAAEPTPVAPAVAPKPPVRVLTPAEYVQDPAKLLHMRGLVENAGKRWMGDCFKKALIAAIDELHRRVVNEKTAAK